MIRLADAGNERKVNILTGPHGGEIGTIYESGKYGRFVWIFRVKHEDGTTRVYSQHELSSV